MGAPVIQLEYGEGLLTPDFYGAGLVCYGDSFTFSSTYGRYTHILSSLIYGPHTNYGVNGNRVFPCASVAMLHTLGRTQVQTIMIGINDLLMVGLIAKKGIISTLRSMLAVAFMGQNVPASALRTVGAWTTWANTNVKARARAIGGVPMFTTQGPATYKEWDFSGDSLVVGTFNTANGAYKDLEVLVDGQSLGILANAGLTADQFGYNCGVYSGLGAGNHTARIRSVLAGNTTMLDYVGRFMAPTDKPPVIVGHIAYAHPKYKHPTSGRSLPNAFVDDVNAAIDAVVAEFQAAGMPVVVARTNDYYDALTEVLPDLLHPTHVLTKPPGPGMFHIFEAFTEKFVLS